MKMGMTIDEAISHCEEVAEEYEKLANTYESFKDYGNLKSSITSGYKKCLSYGKEHRQLAEWLKDYKRLKEQEPILDKIRAEIIEEKDCAYADFEKYKVEYLGQDWEYVYESLPQDDFRNGMERAVEIIDKYKVESEE